MNDLFGEKLMKKEMITEDQLQTAIERQRLHGGRLGHNIVSLGLMKEEDLSAFFNTAPTAPHTVEDTGLKLAFISDLITKHGVNVREFTIQEMGDRIKLPLSIVNKAIDILRKEHLVEITGADQISKLNYNFSLTDSGRRRGIDLISVNRYAGPAPVPFIAYQRMVEKQTIKNILVDEESIRKAFDDLIVNEDILTKLGPAISSGREIFLYGPTGNGKTVFAETIGKVLPGSIYVPHALLVEDEIITLYDKANHIATPSQPETIDKRWMRVKRPVVMVGGELTLKSLDLDFNPITKFYEAPLQMKANNGLFIVDDFGRQQVEPHKLLNRWIVPLERRTDFVTLHTGMKFEIPFDQLVIFATNLKPRKLVDEAFLRRIRYKIEISPPTLREYTEIFQRVCSFNAIEFNAEVFKDLIENYYKKQKVNLNACHCRDLLNHIIDTAYYNGQKPELTKTGISAAWDSYFVNM
jgi:hypothetical protein